MQVESQSVNTPPTPEGASGEYSRLPSTGEGDWPSGRPVQFRLFFPVCILALRFGFEDVLKDLPSEDFDDRPVIPVETGRVFERILILVSTLHRPFVVRH